MTLSVKKLVLASFFLALALVFSFVTMQIPSVGNMLLPMHIPILLCGYLCGAHYGFITGATAPILRSILFGMPPLFPVALIMMFELASYGFITGLLTEKLPSKIANLWLILFAAMIVGRLVWGISAYFLFQFTQTTFSLAFFLQAVFFSSIPGILLQIICIPPLVILCQRIVYGDNHD